VSYLTISGRASARLEVKRSRFLAVLEPAADSDRAAEVVAEERRAHHAARHHCWAWRLRPSGQEERAGDDGEPSGTAGLPMLEVLRGASLSDVVAVVTRYFGGTLLGTGGLTRAYSQAVALAVAEARIVTVVPALRFSLSLDAAEMATVDAALRRRGVRVVSADYGGARCSLVLECRPEDEAELFGHIAAATLGVGRAEAIGTVWQPQ
jgi:uncharacterized YigZ family protein